jgi:hypothetical protein
MTCTTVLQVSQHDKLTGSVRSLWRNPLLVHHLIASWPTKQPNR